MKSAPAAAQSAPGFGSPIISGIQGIGFEQDVRVDPHGNIYTSVPGTLSADTSWIWHSTDGGRTFEWVADAKPHEGKVTACHGGGDTELATGPDGAVYFADLTLANFSTARSDDAGRTFACSNTGVPDQVVDRQWYATDGDPKAGGSLYLTNDEFAQAACPPDRVGENTLVMYRSPVGPLGPSAGIEFGPPNRITSPAACDEGIMGNNEVSPVATATGKLGTDGKPSTLPTPVKHVYVVHDDAALHRILMARCFPVAFGPPVPNTSDPSGLNCDDLPVFDLGTARTGGDFPTMAIDRAGNLYIVWEQAPADADGNITGDTVLMYAYSTDEGTTWSAPIQISPPDLHNNVFAWIAAGDDGRVDVAWYGTPNTADPKNACGTANGGRGGPDAVTNGIWSLYFTQTMDGHDATPTFSDPVVASGHYNHKGTIQTLMGGQCGDRTLGDFLQLRIGPLGEAIISYADSNNVAEIFAPHAMVVRQDDGDGVYAASSPVAIAGLRAQDSVNDPLGDGTWDYSSTSSSNIPNLDITGSSVSLPKQSDCAGNVPCYRITMQLKDLSTTPPGPPDPDTDLVWLTQWLVPADPSCKAATTGSADPCITGGKNFFVYGESNNGGAIQCFDGENKAQAVGGGVTLTYPGRKMLPAANCKVTPGPNGTIAIDAPAADFAMKSGNNFVPALDKSFHSVTASTITMSQRANCCDTPLAQIGGIPFSVIDEAQGYTFTPNGADLSVSITDSPDPAVIGGPVTYTVTVHNAGPFAASNIQLTDVVPNNGVVTSTSMPGATCSGESVITCTLPQLDAGASAAATVGVTAPSTPGSMTDTASVTSDTPDPDPSNNSAAQTTSVGCTITGTDGADKLDGTDGADVLCGLGGDDTITGLGGNDVLLGGDGNDALFAGAGSDRLEGDAGDDRLLPGPDGDPSVDGGAGNDSVDYRDATRGVQVTLESGAATGGSDADHLVGIENAFGSKFADRLTGDASANALDGRSAADLLIGGGGDDELRGGLGADRLRGGAGSDTASYPITKSKVFVNLRKHRARGGGGRDRLSSIENVKGSNRPDVITGSNASNSLIGRGGNDVIHGLGAPDLLDGGPGRDTLDGGAGTDTCLNGEAERSCELPGGGEGIQEVARALRLDLSQADRLLFLVDRATLRTRGRRW